MMTSDFISHKKLELKLIVHYYDESSWKTTLVVDAPLHISSIWVTTPTTTSLTGPIIFLGGLFDQVYPL